MKMRILRMTMSHSQIQKKNNFHPEEQISTVYKNSSFQPEHYFLGRGFFMLIINFFNQLLRYHIFPTRWFSTTYCDQTNIRKGYLSKQFQPLISDTPKKKLASAKLTQIVHTRLSQSDYDILLKRAAAENSDEQKINLSKYLNSIIHDSITANSHSLKMSL